MPKEIIAQISLPNEAGTIVLYAWSDTDPSDSVNLVKMNRDHKIEWTAIPPGGWTDCFTSANFSGGILTAHTWSGYMVDIDIHTGKIGEAVFTK